MYKFPNECASNDKLLNGIGCVIDSNLLYVKINIYFPDISELCFRPESPDLN